MTNLFVRNCFDEKPDRKYLRMIGFQPTAEQIEFVLFVRGFVEKFVKPVVVERDRIADPHQRFPWEIIEKAHEVGVMRLVLSEEYGGTSADLMTLALLSEELGAGDLGVSTLIGQAWNVAKLLEEYGTDYHRCHFLEPFLANPRFLFSVPQTEPQSGTDNSVPQADAKVGIRLSAVRDGDHIVLNGTKHFISGAATASAYLVMARTDNTVPASRGTTAFLVAAGTPGLRVGRFDDCWGQRLCPVAELFFDDCRIPVENQFTPWNERNKAIGRHGSDLLACRAAHYVGIAREAYERSLEYAKLRVQGGKPIIEHQLVAERLGRMYAAIEQVRLVVWKAACNAASENYDAKYQRLPRILAQEMATQVTLDAIRIHGGPGTMTDVGIEKLARDAISGLHPYPGDVHAWLFGRELAGLPIMQ